MRNTFSQTKLTDKLETWHSKNPRSTLGLNALLIHIMGRFSHKTLGSMHLPMSGWPRSLPEPVWYRYLSQVQELGGAAGGGGA